MAEDVEVGFQVLAFSASYVEKLVMLCKNAITDLMKTSLACQIWMEDLQ